jgi:hypothetical protein
MYWSHDVVIFVLFPYLIPSLPIVEDYWSETDFRWILENLLMLFCGISLKETQGMLMRFLKHIFPVSSYRADISDLYFIGNISERCSFDKLLKFSDIQCFYACSFLIENKADIHVDNDIILRHASCVDYKDVVVLLLEHKANVHVCDDLALKLSACLGHKDIVASLLEHKANVHIDDDWPIKISTERGHKEIVFLLLEHKANIGV